MIGKQIEHPQFGKGQVVDLQFKNVKRTAWDAISKSFPRMPLKKCFLAEKKLPPLTTILVRKGERHPHEDAMRYIRSVLGEIDVEAAQHTVFDFDWNCVPELQPDPTLLPNGREVWLTSFWGFDPSK